jgi:hypothetical protein
MGKMKELEERAEKPIDMDRPSYGRTLVNLFGSLGFARLE